MPGPTNDASEVEEGAADGGRDASGDQGARDSGSADTARDDAGGGNGGAAAWRPSDAQIAKLLRMANTAGIDQANAALPKLSRSSIRVFASHMVASHSATQARQSALLESLGLAPVASVLSSNLEYQAAGIVARLQNAAAGEIDRLFIDSQVTLHNQVLDTLDEVLIPNAQDASLQNELTTTRAEVQANVDEAWALAEALATL